MLLAALLLPMLSSAPPTTPSASSGESPPAAAAPGAPHAAAPAASANGPATLVDERFLADYAETRRFLAGRPVNVKVASDGKTALFLRSKARDARQLLYELDLVRGQTRLVASPEDLGGSASDNLTAQERARLERMRVTARGFTSFQLSPDDRHVLLGLAGRLWLVDRQRGASSELATGPGPCIDPRFSPDGAWIAYVRGFDLYAFERATGRELAVTRGGSESLSFGLAEFVAQEEMNRFRGFWFSPDGRRLAFQETDARDVEPLSIVDPLHPESEPQRQRYPRAGRPNARVRVGVVTLGDGLPHAPDSGVAPASVKRGGASNASLRSRATTKGGAAAARSPTERRPGIGPEAAAPASVTWLEWDAERFPYLVTVRWSQGAPLTLVVQNRAQTHVQVLAADEVTGKTRLLLEERDPAWVAIDQGFPLWRKDGGGFFWRTERNGAPEVELRAPDGRLRACWLQPSAGFAELVGFDDATATLVYTSATEPTQRLLFSVREGEEPRRVPTPATPGEPGTERATLGERGGALVVTATSAVELPRTWVQRLDGSGAVEVPSVAETPSLRLEVAVEQHGGLWTALLRPKDFQPGRKYPVILSVYGGPHHQQVTRGQREYLLDQWLANQGFAVLRVDGRGTPGRGAAWERAIKGDFATRIAGDQLAGLRAAAERHPELDTARVGAYGWSFGGYLAALLGLAHPETVKFAVAGAPVVDWRDYDTHYTERYLGLPDEAPQAYAVSSLLSYVADARRPLLVVHGTADDNVYFLHTLKLSDALFRAGKPHEVLPLSNFTHAVPEPNATLRLWERVARAFRDRL